MSQTLVLTLVSILLILLNAFFVTAEYALVGTRRSRIEAMARRKKKNAQGLLDVLDNLSPYVAGVQIGITVVGVAVGSLTEPFITGLLQKAFGGAGIPEGVSVAISIVIITYFLVVFGELFPKYLALKSPEKIAFFTVWPLVWITKLLMPLVAFAQWSASLLLKPLGIDPKAQRSEALPKDELLLLIRTGSTEGVLEEMQADLLARALRLDKLDAKDIMIHRLDIRAVEVNTPIDEVFEKVAEIPHSRIPVYEGDVDTILGILYLYDFLRACRKPQCDLRSLIHPALVVPENLTVDRIIGTMREQKSQIVIVSDEYGGTSGLITLEDIVEEVFGDLEDQIESERPPIEDLPNGRVTARPDVRFDELLARLGVEPSEDTSTDTLATLIINNLGRVPKLGDHVETEIGMLTVENMARRRITRVSVSLKPDLKQIDKDL